MTMTLSCLGGAGARVPSVGGLDRICLTLQTGGHGRSQGLGLVANPLICWANGHLGMSGLSSGPRRVRDGGLGFTLASPSLSGEAGRVSHKTTPLPTHVSFSVGSG